MSVATMGINKIVGTELILRKEMWSIVLNLSNKINKFQHKKQQDEINVTAVYLNFRKTTF